MMPHRIACATDFACLANLPAPTPLVLAPGATYRDTLIVSAGGTYRLRVFYSAARNTINSEWTPSNVFVIAN